LDFVFLEFLFNGRAVGISGGVTGRRFFTSSINSRVTWGSSACGRLHPTTSFVTVFKKIVLSFVSSPSIFRVEHLLDKEVIVVERLIDLLLSSTAHDGSVVRARETTFDGDSGRGELRIHHPFGNISDSLEMITEAAYCGLFRLDSRRRRCLGLSFLSEKNPRAGKSGGVFSQVFGSGSGSNFVAKIVIYALVGSLHVAVDITFLDNSIERVRLSVVQASGESLSFERDFFGLNPQGFPEEFVLEARRTVRALRTIEADPSLLSEVQEVASNITEEVGVALHPFAALNLLCNSGCHGSASQLSQAPNPCEVCGRLDGHAKVRVLADEDTVEVAPKHLVSVLEGVLVCWVGNGVPINALHGTRRCWGSDGIEDGFGDRNRLPTA